MIFNRRGLVLDKKYAFHLKGKSLEITNEYQYLGLKLKPSGSFSLAVQELNDKATRAWFGISNMIFKNKRMEVDRIFCQAQFQLASSVPVQLGTEISLNISVTPHPPHPPGQVYLSHF